MIKSNRIRPVIVQQYNSISLFVDIAICYQLGARSQNQVSLILAAGINKDRLDKPVSPSTVSRKIKRVQQDLLEAQIVEPTDVLFPDSEPGLPRQPTELAFELLDQIQTQLIEMQMWTTEQFNDHRRMLKEFACRVIKDV